MNVIANDFPRLHSCRCLFWACPEIPYFVGITSPHTLFFSETYICVETSLSRIQILLLPDVITFKNKNEYFSRTCSDNLSQAQGFGRSAYLPLSIHVIHTILPILRVLNSSSQWQHFRNFIHEGIIYRCVYFINIKKREVCLVTLYPDAHTTSEGPLCDMLLRYLVKSFGEKQKYSQK